MAPLQHKTQEGCRGGGVLHRYLCIILHEHLDTKKTPLQRAADKALQKSATYMYAF